MRELFPEYYPPTEDELDEIWASGTIVLDTNSLFHFLRYSEATREEFLSVLREKEEQLWIPHQVALEFQRGKLKVVVEQRTIFEQLRTKVSGLGSTLKKDLQTIVGGLSHHPTLDKETLEEDLDQGIAQIEKVVDAHLGEYESTILETGRHEEIISGLEGLFSERIGEAYTAERLKDIYAEGNKRYAAEIPPGYKDDKKESPEKFGDLIIWFQMLDRGGIDNKPMLFVSDDVKEDWILHVSGQKKGPQPALIREFFDRTGARIHFMTVPVFIAYARERGQMIGDATVVEITEISDALNSRERAQLPDASDQNYFRSRQMSWDRYTDAGTHHADVSSEVAITHLLDELTAFNARPGIVAQVRLLGRRIQLCESRREGLMNHYDALMLEEAINEPSAERNPAIDLVSDRLRDLDSEILGLAKELTSFQRAAAESSHFRSDASVWRSAFERKLADFRLREWARDATTDN